MESLLSHDEKTCREHMNNALVSKKKGNSSYKAGDIANAIRKYHNALMFLRAVGLAAETEIFFSSSSNLPKEMIEERDQLRSECYNNLAACLLAKKDTDYQRVAQYCKKVLEISPNNVKAAYRMGQALIHLGELEKAREVLTSNPRFLSKTTVQVLMKTIQEKEKAQDENLKATCMKMFQQNSDPTPKKKVVPTCKKTIVATPDETYVHIPKIMNDKFPLTEPRVLDLSFRPRPTACALQTKDAQMASSSSDEEEAAC